MDKKVLIVEMMYNSDIMVLVYENKRNTVVVWDNQEKKEENQLNL